MIRVLICIAVLFLPAISDAAIIINEIAWMGDIDSANNEWIELHNTGSTASVDGWVLSDNFGLEIELAGSVAAGQYAVLERTDDESAPGTAFLTYTGALSNDGRTLTLRRADGSIEDQVAGGSDWEYVGGDNETKDTAQLTTSGWITAVPTPGKSNQTAPTITYVSDSESEPDKSSDPVSVSLEIPESELKLSIVASKRGYVNQPVSLAVEATGLGKTLLQSLSYEWNLGNLEIATTKEVSAQYDYPGTYVVIVEATYGRHVARARHELTILPTAVSLAHDERGNVLLHNDSKYEVDLSNFELRGHKSVIFPELSYMAPGATLRVLKKDLGGSVVALIALYDAAGEAQAMLVPEVLQDASKQSQKLAAIAPRTVSQVVTESKSVGQILATSTSKTAVPPQTEQLAVAGSTNERLPYLGLVGLMVAGIIAFYAKGARREDERSFFQ